MKQNQLREGRWSSLFTLKNFIILILGFGLGCFVKIQAVKTITMGYDDYKLSQWSVNTNNNDVVDGDINDTNNEKTDKSAKEEVQENAGDKDNQNAIKKQSDDKKPMEDINDKK